MLYKLIKKTGNKKPIIDMIGELSKINDRKKTLKDSYRGKNITISVEPANGKWIGGHFKFENQPKRAK